MKIPQKIFFVAHKRSGEFLFGVFSKKGPSWEVARKARQSNVKHDRDLS